MGLYYGKGFSKGHGAWVEQGPIFPSQQPCHCSTLIVLAAALHRWFPNVEQASLNPYSSPCIVQSRVRNPESTVQSSQSSFCINPCLSTLDTPLGNTGLLYCMYVHPTALVIWTIPVHVLYSDTLYLTPEQHIKSLALTRLWTTMLNIAPISATISQHQHLC